MKNIESVHPENVGWLEIKLEDNEINYVEIFCNNGEATRWLFSIIDMFKLQSAFSMCFFALYRC